MGTNTENHRYRLAATMSDRLTPESAARRLKHVREAIALLMEERDHLERVLAMDQRMPTETSGGPDGAYPGTARRAMVPGNGGSYLMSGA